MRIRELLSETIEQEVDQSLKQMFIPYLAQKRDKVSMDSVLTQMKKLHGQDWDITKDWVMNALDGAEFVKQVTPDEIYLNVDTPQALGSKDHQEKAQDHVSKMAKKTISK